MQLVDTNVISELARPAPNPGALSWAASTSAVALSAVTIEEIFYGLSWKPNAPVTQWFQGFFSERCQVLPISDDIARRCGQLRGWLAARGIVRTQADMLIAATAQMHNLTLVTRNVRDFEECGIPLLNPFSELP